MLHERVPPNRRDHHSTYYVLSSYYNVRALVLPSYLVRG